METGSTGITTMIGKHIGAYEFIIIIRTSSFHNRNFAMIGKNISHYFQVCHWRTLRNPLCDFAIVLMARAGLICEQGSGFWQCNNLIIGE